MWCFILALVIKTVVSVGIVISTEVQTDKSLVQFELETHHVPLADVSLEWFPT